MTTAAVLAEIPTEDGVYAHIPEELYHSDRDSLSSSGARTILWDSPARFHFDQSVPPAPKDHYDMGHLTHLLVLGEGGRVEVLDPDEIGKKADGKKADNPKATKAWKDAVAEVRERGATPVTPADYAVARQMADKVHEHPRAAALLSQGDAEISGWWTDPNTGVRLRWRGDWLHPGRTRLIIVDYKSTKSARPSSFHKSCSDYGYHQQEAWYKAGVKANDLDDDPLFVFIAQEKEPPFLVSVHESHPDDVVRGAALNRKAIDTYAQCRETGVWPGYGDGIHTIVHPTYAITREEAMIR